MDIDADKWERDAQVLIESDWNLNVLECPVLNSQDPVLIESDWNLNQGGGLEKHPQSAVLIESDWNLNLTRFFSFETPSRY